MSMWICLNGVQGPSDHLYFNIAQIVSFGPGDGGVWLDTVNTKEPYLLRFTSIPAANDALNILRAAVGVT